MFTRPRRVFIVLAAPLVLTLAVAVFIATFDWNRARPWLQGRIGAAIQRDVSIDGNLAATWHWGVRRDGADA